MNKSPKFHGDAKFPDLPSDHLKIWAWNINGLNSVMSKGTLAEFLKKTDPDIVCFNEIKTDPNKIR